MVRKALLQQHMNQQNEGQESIQQEIIETLTSWKTKEAQSE
jgi:hypothetical protein